jgi:SAM-dependent methyltransferase
MHPQDAINGRLYARNLVPQYVRHEGLEPAEAQVLGRYRTDCANRRVLDLGCGTGRLAGALLDLTPHYVGLDISPHMIRHCEAHFPTARFMSGDMRKLDLPDASVDTVFAIANLLDAVSHDDRMRVLAGVRRVLVPGGLFVFSSHNRRWSDAGTGPRLEPGGRLIGRLRRLAIAWLNRSRIRRFERATDEYALYNDAGHNYSVLHYYIDRGTQARQLAAAGFTLVEILDVSGTTIRAWDDDSPSSSLLYLARR